jgi:hypothetical protein
MSVEALRASTLRMTLVVVFIFVLLVLFVVRHFAEHRRDDGKDQFSAPPRIVSAFELESGNRSAFMRPHYRSEP